MDNRPVGVYDSGVGGLTVFKYLKSALPDEEYLYFGDTKNLPYGTKSKDELIKIASKIFDFFAEKNTKAVIMACNTTSSVVYDELCNDYDFELYPLIQVAAKCIAPRYSGKLGVFATLATINSGKYKTELLKNNPALDVFEQVCFDWVKVVESGEYNSKESREIIRKSLQPAIDYGCENVILGCTHYPFLTSILEEMSDNKINFINPSIDFVDFVVKDFAQKSINSDKKGIEDIFYVSENPENFKKVSKLFYDLKKLPIKVNL